MKGADFNDRERQKAKSDGVTVVKNSGRGWRKGDARTDLLLIDYKFTEKDSYAINVKKFKDFQKEAWREDRDAVIVPVFDSHSGKSLAVVDWEWLKDIIDKLDNALMEIRIREEREQWT